MHNSLKIALQQVAEEQAEKIIPIAPSKNLDEEIKNLINPPKKQPRMVKMPVKRLVLSAVSLCIVFLLVGWAVLPPLYGATATEYETHIDYVFAAQPKEELRYMGFTHIPEYIPKGYTEYTTYVTGDTYILVLTDDTNNEIMYKEYFAINFSLDNEYDTKKTIHISGGLSGYLFTKDEVISITWFNPQESRVYRISGTLSEKELRKIAKNLVSL